MSDIRLVVGDILWPLDLMVVFFYGGECERDVRQIHLTVEDAAESLVFWRVIGLSNRGWKFISLTIAKADKISIWNEYNE